MKVKPLFIWAGGKSKMMKHYAPLFPSRFDTDIKSYSEPFFGGGAMFSVSYTHLPSPRD